MRNRLFARLLPDASFHYFLRSVLWRAIGPFLHRKNAAFWQENCRSALVHPHAPRPTGGQNAEICACLKEAQSRQPWFFSPQ